ncbi:heme oxygenase (biliverdin-producing) [Euhalothece natronophila Z-M001]|uniref:heme oxygenase (biliverdin-producing) n=1 Tax=Euhalothece natronophila Z-M001 TaxID=522448 RepID=A0A5B8NJ85_9CHRO|nr:heme oxygenase (biliverdin-producing) [Euhalothece natronophila]QDZ39322.1 heme oxygenase (biliverdin-producing) [Euhalothece natronophila Z-M001]
MMSDLAQELREGTKKAHTASENTAFMKCFLKGVMEKKPYAKLMADLYFVYSTLEAEIYRHRDHPVVGKIYFPELERKEKLQQDLAYFFGENWQDKIAPSPAGKVYVDRIKEVSETQPESLIAHSYVRYLGDLSGGQGLRKIARSAMDLPADQGTGLHEFDALPTPEAKKEFKAKYRQALDSIAVNQDTLDAIISEANYVFKLNRDVFHELEDDIKETIGEHTFDLLTRQNKEGSTEVAV